VHGLIFDCDGILADTEQIVFEATRDMFRELYGAELERKHFEPYIGTGPIKYVEGPARDNGIEIELDKAVKRREEKFIQILQDGRDISFPGVGELVEASLSAGDWKTAIATSSSRAKSKQSLKAARVPANKFDAYVTGDDVEEKKPDPAIYLRAADEIGLPPERCIGIEDSTIGVEAVINAGMVCVAVTNTFSHEELSKAHWVVDSLEEVALDKLRKYLDEYD